MTSQTSYTEERAGTHVSAEPLGLIALAFTTALVGCSFAHLFVLGPGMGIGVITGAALLFGGVAQFIAGMWELRNGNSITGTTFSTYGGFLAALGAFLLPSTNLLGYFGDNPVAINHALGLLFLCWTICVAVLLVSAPRTNMLMLAVLALLGLSYLFLMIGQFAGTNIVLLMIGGWLGILCAVVAWYAALVSLLAHGRSTVREPLEQMA